MNDEHAFFSPERVDEQVDDLFQDEARRMQRQQKTGDSAQAERRLVKDLWNYYQAGQAEDSASLERAWKRVSLHFARTSERPRTMDKTQSSVLLRSAQERNHPMYNQVSERSNEKKAVRWPGMLAAVLVAIVLVGGLLTVLNLTRRSMPSTGSPSHVSASPSPRPTPTAAPIGTTVYSATSTSLGGYQGFLWSPDSKRIASLEGSVTEVMQIWDATTGAHKVKFALSSSNEWILSAAWSPVNQDIAVGTNQRLIIIDGQTGAILHSYTSGITSINTSGSPYLSSLEPASGGLGYRSLGWSPDGHYLAAGISFGPSGSIQVWNMQTGTVSYTLSLGSSYVITSTVWSTDGQYLAAHGFNSQTGQNDIEAAWKASTRQMIFQEALSMDGSDAPIYWQPQTHNLAFMAIVNQYSTLEIWDVLTGKALHTYTGKGSDSMAFSPDGKDLAYDTSLNNVAGQGDIAIMDIDSGAQIFLYKDSNSVLAWSPGGQYIVSASGGQQVLNNGQVVLQNGIPETTPGIARVWVA